jgi:type II secretory pathway pseudopilin PulG
MEVLAVLSIIGIVIGTAGIGISLASSRDAEQGGRAVDIAIANARLGAMSKTDRYEVRIVATNTATGERGSIGVKIDDSLPDAPASFARTSPTLPSRVNVEITIPDAGFATPNPAEVRILFSKASGRVQRLRLYSSSGTLIREYTAATTPRLPNVLRIRVINPRGDKASTVVLITNTGRQYMEYGVN